MKKENKTAEKGARPFRRWIRRAFVLWGIFAFSWMANGFRTQGVDDRLLRASPTIAVNDTDATLEFVPADPAGAALVFICGSGVAAEAYVPLLRPLARSGYPVFIVKLPWRFALLETHRREAVERVGAVIARHPRIGAWVVGGHSLGGALACRAVRDASAVSGGLVLVGTTHPKEDDLSGLAMPVTKIFGSADGVAPAAKVRANQGLLPPHTQWVEIEGGNHVQFGHYGYQLLDGEATISRLRQQEVAREKILEALSRAAG